MESTEQIFEYLQNELDDEFTYTEAEVGQDWITIRAGFIREACKFLRDDPQLRFNTLMCLSGVHYPKDNELGVTYHLHSTSQGHTLVLKVRVPEDQPLVPSVQSIWKTANWHEREAFDLLGVQFEGHPDLRRILTPEDWEGHPLRKDYEPQDSYQNISTGI